MDPPRRAIEDEVDVLVAPAHDDAADRRGASAAARARRLGTAVSMSGRDEDRLLRERASIGPAHVDEQVLLGGFTSSTTAISAPRRTTTNRVRRYT
jgi:hypothetical protein